MGRRTLENEQYEMAYGIDHICGKFIQIFDKSKAKDEDEGLILNLDERFDKLTLDQLFEIAARYGFELNDERE